MTEKIVVSNAAALRAKYGRGYSAVLAAVRRWIAADRARGMSTRLVALDSAATMKRYHGRAVTDATNAKQNKDAIDAVYATARPDYLVILGAADVVPHQDLANPLYSPDDPDRHASSDLPYACEAPYGRRINDFIGPTRVVGRLPDVAGATSPEYLVNLIDLAAQWQPLPRERYEHPFALTAKVWEGSTRLSLRALFRSDRGMRISPPRGPRWSNADMSRLLHFINCHGAVADPQFYGDDGNALPVSHRATNVPGRITRGTVAAVECCYGAELYDPRLLPDGQRGIANVYLAEGAYGYFGSTTIAYGDAETNSAADLLCQYFLANVLAGASLGRAALEARQRYAREDTDLDPVDLKTLGQFVLLGDPSIHPVIASEAPAPKTRRGRAEAAAAAMATIAQDPKRQDRRLGLLRKGLAIMQTQGTAVRGKKAPARGIVAMLRKEARGLSLTPSGTLSFAIELPVVRAPNTAMKAMRAAAGAPASFHVMFAHAERREPGEAAVTLLVAKEVDGEIVSVKRLQRR